MLACTHMHAHEEGAQDSPVQPQLLSHKSLKADICVSDRDLYMNVKTTMKKKSLFVMLDLF